MQSERLALIFGAYWAVSFCCYLFWRKRGKNEALYRLALVIFLPVVGYLLLMADGLTKKRAVGESATEGSVKGECVTGTGPEPGQDVVPLEEALFLNTGAVRRKMVLNTLKGDPFKYPRLLKLAVANDDLETSHYATAAIVEMKRKAVLGLQQIEDEKDKDHLDARRLAAHAKALKRYLSSSLLNEETQDAAQSMLKDILDRLVALCPDEESWLLDRLDCDIEDGDYDAARVRCQRLTSVADDGDSAGRGKAAGSGEAGSGGDAAIAARLKIAYLCRDRAGFEEALDLLEEAAKQAPQQAGQMKDLIQFWRFAKARR